MKVLFCIASFVLASVVADGQFGPLQAFPAIPTEPFSPIVGGPLRHGNPHGGPHAPASYEFGYGVHDDLNGGANFGHNEARNGDDTHGEYRVNLPDGRTQIVTYSSNPATGYVANVRYENTLGVAPVVPAVAPVVPVVAPVAAPLPPPRPIAPAYPHRPAYAAPFAPGYGAGFSPYQPSPFGYGPSAAINSFNPGFQNYGHHGGFPY